MHNKTVVTIAVQVNMGKYIVIQAKVHLQSTRMNIKIKKLEYPINQEIQNSKETIQVKEICNQQEYSKAH